MTAVARPFAVPLVLLLSTAALAVRVAEPGSVALVVSAGAAGLLLCDRAEGGPVGVPLVVGSAAFIAVALLMDAPPPPIWWWGVASAVLAAVCEEVFFRGAMYGWLERHGHAVAVVVTALAFALVHVRAYGWDVLPLDLAAGLVFGWQRWVSGRWTVPAATHVLANLIATTG